MCDDRIVTSDEIRESYLSFFEKRGHKRLPSASLVPASYDPSVLLTTAGMHPLKPYFLGLETPPASRLTSCQKCFRTPDIDVVGTTTRHLTFFEMLGNFSMGDYFKQGAAELAWEMSLEGFGFDPEKIWVTVFEGDEELGLGLDEEAVEAWLKIGVPRERIVPCPRSENFWQAGETGPCGPCSELYYDRGLEWGTEDDLPGGDNERFLEYWNLVFMQYNQDPVNTLTPLPKKNIDTGLGLNRMALIQQGVDSIFDTDQFIPLMELGRSLATNPVEERALRILADHTRGMTFLIADGVVPSNEDRGYVLRRLMRRAIAQGHRLGFEGEFLPKYVDVVHETMGAAYPELGRERDTILRWVRAEEQGFGRTLETGLTMLDDLLARGEVSGEDAFKLHDTFGFPIDLTTEIAGERDVPVDIAGFDELMEEQRVRSSAGAGSQERVGAKQEVIRQLSEAPTEFTGYEHLEERTTVAGVLEQGGRTFVKLASSPFYAQGGGQVSDAGVVETEDGAVVGTVNEVLRSGEDQAVVLEGDHPVAVGAKVVARVDRPARQATQANHTATHLLHAALREALGTHVRQAGSYVGPDKLRFDFTHGTRLSPDELKGVEDRVNEWVLQNDPVRPITTTLKEAQELGAMALFGEKYGDVVRMVQIGAGDYSRELCGGTHVRSTAEIGVFKIVSEGSSASNVRRIEAVTGPEAVTLLRSHDALIREAAGELRTSPEQVPAKVADLQAQLKAAAKAGAAGANGAVDVAALAGGAVEVSGAKVLTSVVEVGDAKALLDATDRVKNTIGDAAIVLGAVTDGKVALIASVAPSLVERGLKAGELVKVAAQVVGGGGGGRDTMAQAGGRDPEKLDDALAAARAHIESTLAA
jgi:alanyl-tRNA synthetase